MGRSLDSNIYGADELGQARGVWTDALDTSLGDADYWGDIQDARGTAKANVGAESTGPDDPKTPVVKGTGNSAHGTLAGGGDSEALTSPYPQLQRFPRHVRGPKGAHDVGDGIKRPPPRNQLANKKGGSPRP